MVAETGHDPNTQQNLMTKHPFFGNFIQPAFITHHIAMEPFQLSIHLLSLT